MDKTNEEIIDLGVWETPKSWDDLSLKTYQEIVKFYDGTDKNIDVREIVHILCGKTIDEVNALPLEFFEMIIQDMAFVLTTPEVKEPSNKITINGETYVVNIMEKLKTGEWVALDTIIKNDKFNYAAMLAVLCRKEGEIYDSNFEANIFEERQKMWEKQPVMNILPIITFFLLLWLVSGKHSQLYMEVEEAVNHIQQNLETSQKLGAFRKLYLKWQMKKLKRSLRSINNTSQTSSFFSRISFKKGKWKTRKINSNSSSGTQKEGDKFLF